MLSEQYVKIALGERLPSECRIPLRIKRSQIHILLAAALAALGACAPLAKVNKTEPKLGANMEELPSFAALSRRSPEPEVKAHRSKKSGGLLSMWA